MVRRIGILVLLLVSMCGVELAQGTAGVALDTTPPSRAQVLALMSAMGVQKNVDASLRGAQAKMKAAAHDSFVKKNPDADAASLKKLDAVFDSTPLFGFEDISETLVSVYQKHLSAADVQAGIDFYTSDAGKRLLANLPVIIRESNESSGQLVQAKLQAYSAEIERKLEAFQAEMASANKSNDTSKTKDQKSK